MKYGDGMALLAGGGSGEGLGRLQREAIRDRGEVAPRGRGRGEGDVAAETAIWRGA